MIYLDESVLGGRSAHHHGTELIPSTAPQDYD
jgi:hypothetical protein